MIIVLKQLSWNKNHAEGQIKLNIVSTSVWQVRVDMFLINPYKYQIKIPLIW